MDKSVIANELDVALRQKDDGDKQFLEDKVKSILENVWKNGLTNEDALYVITFLVNVQNIPKKAKITVRNFVIVYFHFLAYCVYCTENTSLNMLGNNLAIMLFKKNGGRKQVIKEMKAFYKSMGENQKMHYQSIVLGLYVSAFTGNESSELKITQDQILQKDWKAVISNFQYEKRFKAEISNGIGEF